MKNNEMSKEDIEAHIRDCCFDSNTPDDFAYLMINKGFVLHANEKEIYGFSHNGTLYQLKDFAYIDKGLETLAPPFLTEEEFETMKSLSQEYKEPLSTAFTTLEEAPKVQDDTDHQKEVEEAIRENELNEIRDGQGLEVENEPER